MARWMGSQMGSGCQYCRGPKPICTDTCDDCLPRYWRDKGDDFAKKARECYATADRCEGKEPHRSTRISRLIDEVALLEAEAAKVSPEIAAYADASAELALVEAASLLAMRSQDTKLAAAWGRRKVAAVQRQRAAFDALRGVEKTE